MRPSTKVFLLAQIGRDNENKKSKNYGAVKNIIIVTTGGRFCYLRIQHLISHVLEEEEAVLT